MRHFKLLRDSCWAPIKKKFTFHAQSFNNVWCNCNGSAFILWPTNSTWNEIYITDDQFQDNVMGCSLSQQYFSFSKTLSFRLYIFVQALYSQHLHIVMHARRLISCSHGNSKYEIWQTVEKVEKRGVWKDIKIVLKSPNGLTIARANRPLELLCLVSMDELPKKPVSIIHL